MLNKLLPYEDSCSYASTSPATKLFSRCSSVLEARLQRSARPFQIARLPPGFHRDGGTEHGSDGAERFRETHPIPTLEVPCSRGCNCDRIHVTAGLCRERNDPWFAHMTWAPWTIRRDPNVTTLIPAPSQCTKPDGATAGRGA